jgi:hypothetical protein
MGLLRKPFKSKAVRGTGIRVRFANGRFANVGRRRNTFKGRAKLRVNNKGVLSNVTNDLRKLTKSKTRRVAFESILEPYQPIKPKAVNRVKRLATKLKTRKDKVASSKAVEAFRRQQAKGSYVYAHIDTPRFKAGFKYARPALALGTASTLTAVIAKSVMDRVSKSSYRGNRDA